MKRLILALGALLMLTGAAGATPFKAAQKEGAVDNSLFCPAGSGWYPAQGGVCLSCPDGKKPKAGICPGLEKKTKKAKFSYERKFKASLCKPRHFRRPKTRECYTCGKGYIRIPGKKFSKKAHMCVAIKPTVRKARIVRRVKLKELLNPENLKQEFADLGCRGYGKDAFFSLRDGGICMSCPATHPRRSLHPASSSKACMTTSCGNVGERSCLITEHILPCRKGASYSPFKSKCVAPKNIACKPIIQAVRGINTSIAEANAAGQAMTEGALSMIPGFKLVNAMMDGVVDRLQDQMIGMVARMPLDAAFGDLDRLFAKPKEVESIQRAMVAVAKAKPEIERLLTAEEICGGNERLLKLIVKRINESRRASRDDRGGRIHRAAVSGRREMRVMVPALHGRALAFSVGAQVYLKKGGVQLPVGFGLEYVIAVDNDGYASLSAGVVLGLDNPWKSSIGEFGATAIYVSYLPPQNANCEAPPIGLQIEAVNIVGLTINKCGLLSWTLKVAGGATEEVAEIFTSTEPRKLLAKLPEMRKKIKPGKDSLQPLPVQAALSIGLNTSFGLVIVGGTRRTALAP